LGNVTQASLHHAPCFSALCTTKATGTYEQQHLLLLLKKDIKTLITMKHW